MLISLLTLEESFGVNRTVLKKENLFCDQKCIPWLPGVTVSSNTENTKMSSIPFTTFEVNS